MQPNKHLVNVRGLVKYSIPITLVTFILGLIIALFTALMRISTSKLLRGIARVYVSIIRGTPMIVQLFIIFMVYRSLEDW